MKIFGFLNIILLVNYSMSFDVDSILHMKGKLLVDLRDVVRSLVSQNMIQEKDSHKALRHLNCVVIKHNGGNCSCNNNHCDNDNGAIQTEYVFSAPSFLDVLILFLGAFGGIASGVYSAANQSNKILEIEAKTREKLLQIEFLQENVIQKQDQILIKKVQLI